MWLVRCFENKSPGSEGVAGNGVPGFVSGPSVIPRLVVRGESFYFSCPLAGVIAVNTEGMSSEAQGCRDQAMVCGKIGL